MFAHFPTLCMKGIIALIKLEVRAELRSKILTKGLQVKTLFNLCLKTIKSSRVLLQMAKNMEVKPFYQVQVYQKEGLNVRLLFSTSFTDFSTTLRNSFMYIGHLSEQF